MRKIPSIDEDVFYTSFSYFRYPELWKGYHRNTKQILNKNVFHYRKNITNPNLTEIQTPNSPIALRLAEQIHVVWTSLILLPSY